MKKSVSSYDIVAMLNQETELNTVFWSDSQQLKIYLPNGKVITISCDRTKVYGDECNEVYLTFELET